MTKDKQALCSSNIERILLWYCWKPSVACVESLDMLKKATSEVRWFFAKRPSVLPRDLYPLGASGCLSVSLHVGLAAD